MSMPNVMELAFVGLVPINTQGSYLEVYVTFYDRFFISYLVDIH